MAPSPLSLKRSLLLSTVFVLSLLTAGGMVAAQDDDNTTPAAGTSTTTTQAAATTTTTTAKAATTTTSTAKGTTSTTMPKISTSSSSISLPGLSTSSSSSATGKVTMPTLSKTADNSFPTYPAPSVPPTQNAPFMQQSKLPAGTVFIAVGAILGAFGAAILIWRAVVACLLHRSVERAAMAQHHANDKAAFPAPPAPFYKYSDRDSSPNLTATSGRGVRRTTRGPIPSSTPSQTNLFFSPTAAPGATGSMNASNRDSRFLPSGFYAAGTSSPANAHGPSISLTNLRPDSRGHARPVGHSPPESPPFGPSRLSRNNLSTSSVNLHRPPSGRAPSAFLEDLLDDQPGMFPPAGAPPSQHPSYGPGQPPSQGRF